MLPPFGSFDLPMEESMAKNGSQFMRCACCGNPFPVVEGRVQQWRVGNQYACNEFCAEGVEDRQPKESRP